MGAINAFGEFLTPTVYVAVLSFLAYVIGMLLMVDIRAGSTIRLGRKFILPYVSDRDRTVIDALIESAFHRARVRRADGHEIEREFGLGHMIKTQMDHDILHSSNGGSERDMDDDLRNNALRQLKKSFFDEIIGSIPALAIKLQDKNQLLYGSYDRDKSESEFRLSISLPLAALSVQFLALGYDRQLTLWPWAAYAGAIAVVALAVKGLQKRFSSVNVVVTSLEIGTIKSQMIARLDAVPSDVYESQLPATSFETSNRTQQ